MVTSISSTGIGAFTEYVTDNSARIKSSTVKEPSFDVIEISPAARSQLKADMAAEAADKTEKQDEQSGPSWFIGSGLKEGEYTLKNGNKQKVVIDGNGLTIEESKNGRLLKSVAGTISNGAVVLDTEYFDSAGRVSQSIHTEMDIVEAEKGWTAAVMRRDVTWFEGGQRKGELHDNMQLQTWNGGVNVDEETNGAIKEVLSSGTDAIDTNVQSLASSLTVEKHVANYYAQIKEYAADGATLLRDMTIEQDGHYTQLSNPTGEQIGPVGARSTVNLEHNVGLRINLKEYDESGDLVKESRFSDRQKDKINTTDGTVEQTMDVSWYNQGELVKTSHGSMTLEETGDRKLPDRPSFLELFGLNNEDYVAGSDHSAAGHMSKRILTSSAEADFYLDGLSNHINGHDYSSAEGVAQWGDAGRPYSLEWTDEIYQDGEVVLRQKDTEGARESSLWQQERALLFRTGAALTENESPKLLRESSHEREVFENGRSTSHTSMKAREWVDADMDGPDELRTTASFMDDSTGRDTITVINGKGGLAGVDQDSHAAARGYANETEQALDTLQATFAVLARERPDTALNYRVRLRQ